MVGSDRRDDPEWPIGSDDTGRPASREEDRALRFGGEHERHVRHEHTRNPYRQPRDEASREAPAPDRRGINPVLLALGGLVLLLLLAWLLVGKGNPDQDKLTNVASNGTTSASADPEKLCASKTTYDGIKRELFRRAAQVRGSDQAAFDRIAAYAVLRMQNPVMESHDSANAFVNCSGSLSLDLPPGIAVVGGRTSLASDVDYSVQAAADKSGNVVLLKNADAIITPLATLSRVSPPVTPAPEVPSTGAAPAPVPVAPQPPTPPSAAPIVRPTEQSAPARPTTTARPSFNCGNARTRGEIAVCANAGLAALDRQMAAQYRGAIANASPEERAILQRTRDRFLGYRDRCPNNSCIGDAYVGRMREIRDIMEGRWQQPR